MTERQPVIEIKDLNLHIARGNRDVHILKNMSHTIYPGEIWGIAGESGAGKSMTMYAMLSLLPERRTTLTGNIRYLEPDGTYTDLLTMPFQERGRYCANKVSLILQDSINALNPFECIETQWTETVLLHRPDADRERIPGHIERLLRRFGIPSGKTVMKKYPHQLSGGQRQRIAIAMALESGADILVADEPTTSLDTINQRKIIDFIVGLCEKNHLTMLYITHNLGIIQEICTHVAVMRYGEVIERGTIDEVFGSPKADYTKSLIAETLKLKGGDPR
ncbi:MAG: ABC transporter ATP-binding protein [Eubacteriaceae bacterium]|nr:ABC transporter ATP-binding protein [Eubacteriaceae bacterium]